MDLTASILVDTIFLLINENNEYTRELANKLILLFKESKVVDSEDTDVIRFYIRILHRIISEKIDKSSMDLLRSLMLKMKSEAIFASHKEYLLDLEKTLLDDIVMSEAKRNTLKQNIRLIIRINESDRKVKRAFNRIQRIKDMDSLDARKEALKEFEIEFGQTETSKDPDDNSGYDGPKPLDSISSDDPEALKSAFIKLHDRRSAHVVKTGQQGLNKAFGKERGLAADSSVVVLAPSHNGKSMFLNNFAYWGAKYNDYEVKEDGTKPCIFIATTENGAQENYLLIYEKIYFEQHNEMPAKMRAVDGKPLAEDVDVRVKTVLDFFKERNITLLVESYSPHEFGPIDFVSRLKSIMKAGYYIPIAIFDYLMKSKLPAAAREDIAVGAAYNLVCNFTKHHGIMFLTGHQYTRDGVIRLDGKIDKVKSMNEGGVKGGYDAFQTVDVVLYLILEADHNGQVYTTMKLAKHRYVTDTPPADKYMAYPIKGGAIKDDANDPESRAVKDIYSEGMTGSGYIPKAKQKESTTENDSLF